MERVVYVAWDARYAVLWVKVKFVCIERLGERWLFRGCACSPLGGSIVTDIADVPYHINMNIRPSIIVRRNNSCICIV